MAQVGKKCAVLRHQNTQETDMRSRYAAEKQTCAKSAQTCAKLL